MVGGQKQLAGQFAVGHSQHGIRNDGSLPIPTSSLSRAKLFANGNFDALCTSGHFDRDILDLAFQIVKCAIFSTHGNRGPYRFDNSIDHDYDDESSEAF